MEHIMNQFAARVNQNLATPTERIFPLDSASETFSGNRNGLWRALFCATSFTPLAGEGKIRDVG